MYVSAKVIRSKYGVYVSTLRHWANSGRLSVVRTPGGKRLYDLEGVSFLFGDGESRPDPRARIIYARVSGSHQRGDLERQVQRLSEAYPEHEVVKDVGSGVNWKRKGLASILDRAFAGNIEELVLEHRDRLCRFGYELLALVFEKLDVRLLVHSPDEGAPGSGEQELADDLLAVVNFFVAKNNGTRASKNRRKRKAGEKEAPGQ
jgi:predicted site-specific integrase-resolvase